ncbi:MAG TPA: cytochrome c oxidase subunit II [Cyclobacteriaceae bacterium]|nr:cytochrome c oxidase subunit II [Cyclobacteriaceae bacterium]
MLNLIVILSSILVVAILFMIFRISNLVGIVKGRPEDGKPDAQNKLNANLFLWFLIVGMVAFFWYSVKTFDQYNLPLASEHGAVTDMLFWVTMAVSVIVFFVVNIVLFYFAFVYQYKEGNKATFFADNTKLELIWTVVPAIVLTGLIFTGLNAWNDITGEASEDAEVIEVVAQQFGWSTRYPGVKDNTLGNYHYQLIGPVNEFGLDLTDPNTYDDFKALELHLPKGKEVLLKIRAKDVLHSVFLPHFRVKMDAVPGMPTHFKFIPTKSTAEMRAETGNPDFNYELACTEICGYGHFSMRMLVVVHEPADFEKWKAEQEPWLKQNPEFLEKVPANLREMAMIKAGFDIDEVAASAQIGNSNLVTTK